jgi:hypothetical protein
MMKDAEIQGIAKKALEAQLARRAVIDCVAHSEEDFDGASVVQVDALVEPPDASAEDRLAVIMAIRARLSDYGDDRFVFLRIRGQNENLDTDEDEDDDPDPQERAQ